MMSLSGSPARTCPSNRGKLIHQSKDSLRAAPCRSGRGGTMSLIRHYSLSVVQRILDIPAFLVKPSEALQQLFGPNYRTGRGVVAGLGYLALGIATFYAAGAARGVDFTHLRYLIEGSAVTWVLYGLFMHFFVRLWGGRKGFARTIDAYAYTIGILQPVLAFVLFALSFVFPIDYRWDVVQRSLGASGTSQIIAEWVFSRAWRQAASLSFAC